MWTVYLVGALSLDQVIVNAARFDGVDQVDNDFGIGYGRVLEASQAAGLAGIRQLAVHPGDDLLLDDRAVRIGQRAQHGQRVCAHNLPD